MGHSQNPILSPPDPHSFFATDSPNDVVDVPHDSADNLSAPKNVFKDDVASGIAGYNKGAKMATAAAATAIGASIPAVRTAAV